MNSTSRATTCRPLRDYCLQALDYFGGQSQIEPGGFPLFFHVENRDTGYLKYSSDGPTNVQKLVRTVLDGLSVNLTEYNSYKSFLYQKNFLRQVLVPRVYHDVGGLDATQEAMFCQMIWFTLLVYKNYAGIYDQVAKTPIDTTDDVYGRSVQQERETREKRVTELRESRKTKQIIEYTLDTTFFSQDDDVGD
jgi:hypothetical protein